MHKTSFETFKTKLFGTAKKVVMFTGTDDTSPYGVSVATEAATRSARGEGAGVQGAPRTTPHRRAVLFD